MTKARFVSQMVCGIHAGGAFPQIWLIINIHSLPTESTTSASGLRRFHEKFTYFPGPGIGKLFSETFEIHGKLVLQSTHIAGILGIIAEVAEMSYSCSDGPHTHAQKEPQRDR